MKITWFSILCHTLLFLTAAFLVNEPFAGGADGRKRITLRDAARQLGADRIGEYLPAETRMYVPKVLATVYYREGVEPEDLPPPTGS